MKACLTDFKLLHKTEGTWENRLQGKVTPGKDGRKKGNKGRREETRRF